MKLLTEASEAVGKTLSAFQLGDNDEQAVLVFTDGTFLSLRSCRVSDDTEIEVQAHFDPLSWEYRDLEKAFGSMCATLMFKAEVARREVARLEARSRRKAQLEAELKRLEAEDE